MNDFEIEVQKKLDEDSDFQASLTSVVDETEKASLIEAKRKEFMDSTFKELREKAGEADKTKQIAEDQRKRAEKAEAEIKKHRPAVEKKDDDKISTKDFYALTSAKVPEEDVDDVLEYAKFKGITVGEALKSSVIKATLAEKSEVRKTANATQTRQTRSQATAVDGDTVLQNAKTKGEDGIPDGGSKDAEAMFWARRGRKPF